MGSISNVSASKINTAQHITPKVVIVESMKEETGSNAHLPKSARLWTQSRQISGGADIALVALHPPACHTSAPCILACR